MMTMLKAKSIEQTQTLWAVWMTEQEECDFYLLSSAAPENVSAYAYLLAGFDDKPLVIHDQLSGNA